MNRVLILAALAIVLLLGASCSTGPVTPGATSPAEPEFATILDGPAGVASPLGVKIVGGARTAATETVQNVGPAGGVVACGRYSVTIPAGALSQTVAITVRPLEQDGSVGCELLPHGLQFLVPAQLKMSLSGTTMATQLQTTIYWWDAANADWVDISGTYAGADQSVVAPLAHFSQYKAGRAGW